MSEPQAEARGENALDDEYFEWLKRKEAEFVPSSPCDYFEAWMFRGFFETECAWRVRAEWREQDQKIISELERSVAFWKRDALNAVTVIRSLQKALDETVSALLENRRPNLVDVHAALKMAANYEKPEATA